MSVWTRLPGGAMPCHTPHRGTRRMTASLSSVDRLPGVPKLSGADAPARDDASARRAVDALERLRGQLTATQDVLDDFLGRLDDAARPRGDRG
jgi:hypothetical protein